MLSPPSSSNLLITLLPPRLFPRIFWSQSSFISCSVPCSAYLTMLSSLLLNMSKPVSTSSSSPVPLGILANFSSQLCSVSQCVYFTITCKHLLITQHDQTSAEPQWAVVDWYSTSHRVQDIPMIHRHTSEQYRCHLKTRWTHLHSMPCNHFDNNWHFIWTIIRNNVHFFSCDHLQPTIMRKISI